MGSSGILALWFVHAPLAWAALPAGAAAVLVHLLLPGRHRPMRWAAMQFLVAAKGASRRRLRLERWLLIALRTAMLVLLALALARPLLGPAKLLSARGRDAALLIVLDNGLAMQAPSHKPPQTLWQEAIESIRPVVRSWRGKVGLLTCLPGRTRRSGMWFERADLAAEALARLKLTAGRADWQAVFAEAQALLAASQVAPDRRTVVLLTTLRRGNWADAAGLEQEIRRLEAAARRVLLVDLEPASSRNVAVTDLAVEAAFSGQDLPVRAGARVVNYSQDQPAKGLTVVWSVDGREVRRDRLPEVPAGSEHGIATDLPPLPPGEHHVAVRLVDRADALAADDGRWAFVAMPEELRIVVVEPAMGGPAGRRASLFVTAALKAAAEQSSIPIGLDVVGPAELASALLEPADAVLLCNINGLPPADWQRLAEQVRAGCGLLAWLGSRSDLENYRFASDLGLLPGTPEGVLSAETQGGWPLRLRLPVPAIFADLARGAVGADSGSLGLVRRLVEVVPSEAASVLLAADSALPVILAQNVGTARSVLVATSPDLAWSNMASRPTFPALLLALLRTALPQDITGRQVLCGRAITVPLAAGPAGQEGQWVKPDGSAGRAEFVTEQDRMLASLPQADLPGPYRLTVSGRDYLAVANADGAAGDLRPLPGRLRRALADGGAEVIGRDRLAALLADTLRSEWTGPACYAVLFLALTEALLTAVFTRAREP